MAVTTLSRDQILDTTLALAARVGWESLRLHEVASACGLGLEEIRREFREKDALIDAWFDRADAAMLALADSGALNSEPPAERIRRLLQAWLDALAPYHQVTRGMVAHKLEFGHLHVQLPALLRISRTVQWLREAARLDAPLPRRALEEVALTSLFVKTFAQWLVDAPPDFSKTRRRLERDLRGLEKAARWLPRAAPKAG